MVNREAALARRLALLVVTGVLGAGCGRLGFEPLDRGGLPDGGNPDGVTFDVPFDPMTLTGCSQAAPFLHLIDVIQVSNPSTQYARYCYAGLAGPLLATVHYAVDDDVYFLTTVPIADRVVALQFGSGGCAPCYVRLQADGLTVQGPVTDFSGD